MQANAAGFTHAVAERVLVALRNTTGLFDAVGEGTGMSLEANAEVRRRRLVKAPSIISWCRPQHSYHWLCSLCLGFCPGSRSQAARARSRK